MTFRTWASRSLDWLAHEPQLTIALVASLSTAAFTLSALTNP